MAESVFHDLVRNEGLQQQFVIESAGTVAYHIGEKPDHRTINILNDVGIQYYSLARRATPEDFINFDYILAMDHSNLVDLESIKPDNTRAKLELFRQYDVDFGNGIVPDPYYGNRKDFQNVYNIVKRCSKGFLEHINKNFHGTLKK